MEELRGNGVVIQITATFDATDAQDPVTGFVGVIAPAELPELDGLAEHPSQFCQLTAFWRPRLSLGLFVVAYLDSDNCEALSGSLPF
ncbi:hypothetical protein [Bordetella bronchiseptica]|uniref:hypothetical protein n=1 Tax=Bordetella bronchiseptica TaxID=518 RepID=UPI001300AF7F|nr:hypothetical protein [Bordetella bronchiseptica]